MLTSFKCQGVTSTSMTRFYWAVVPSRSGTMYYRKLATNLCLCGNFQSSSQSLHFILCPVFFLLNNSQLLAQIHHFKLQQLQVLGVLPLYCVQLILQKRCGEHRRQQREGSRTHQAPTQKQFLEPLHAHLLSVDSGPFQFVGERCSSSRAG